MTYSARESGRAFVLPTQSAEEAALVRGAEIYPAATLLQVCAHLEDREALVKLNGRADARPALRGVSGGVLRSEPERKADL